MNSVTAPVRILHPITRLIVGGAQENTMLTAGMLNKELFEVEILSGPQTGSEGSLIDEVRSHGIPLHIIPELVRQINPRLDLLAYRSMTDKIRLGKYSLVHTHSSKAGILGRFAARRAAVPKIVHTVHGWSFHDFMPPLSKWIYTWLERSAAAFTDALIVVSRHDLDAGIRARIGRREQYHLIRSAIPIEEYEPSAFDREAIRSELDIPLGAIVIGNVGRFSLQKNPLDWVRVASLVGKEYPEVNFLLVGDGPLHRQVKDLVEQEGIANRTVLTGIRRDVARMLSAMDIFLVTSLWEGLPRSVLQAMRMKLPVVAYHIGGLPEIIQHEISGFLSPSKDLAQTAIYCGYLVENSVQRQSMGESGYSLVVQDFSLTEMIRQIEELYGSLLEDLT